ncbi:hypothetical protein [Streptomyces formicae]|uniref:hypothetical protein n=1 Tax=Streptomyces formicae TaxID=1616117 RepID=UPI001F577287|nr:hypothetical protein [Streptomyces formicae]
MTLLLARTRTPAPASHADANHREPTAHDGPAPTETGGPTGTPTEALHHRRYRHPRNGDLATSTNRRGTSAPFQKEEVRP